MHEIVTEKIHDKTGWQLSWAGRHLTGTHKGCQTAASTVRKDLHKKNLRGPNAGQTGWFGSGLFLQGVASGECLNVAWDLGSLGGGVSKRPVP